LRWSFVEEVLKEICLPSELVYLIINCISSMNKQILWNGSTTDKFKPSRGIRQGDPISPSLFVLCMEKLSYIILEVVEKE